MDVSTFTGMARAEFVRGQVAAEEKPYPAAFDSFTTKLPSSTKVETHTWLSALPRLYEFEGTSFVTDLVDHTYTVANRTFRVGPVQVPKNDLDDDQIGGYMMKINAMPALAQKDVGFRILSHLAAGASTKCFDGSNFFAGSHVFGTGDNDDTANYASNDSAAHRVIGLIVDNPDVKPVVFQDRESLGSLETDAETPLAKELRQYKYWTDCRFGLAYGFWWDAYNVAITDTPTIEEILEELFPKIINGFRSFLAPKGRDIDEPKFIHEGWTPTSSNFILLSNLKLGELLTTAVGLTQYSVVGGLLNNPYHNKATVIPTSALGA